MTTEEIQAVRHHVSRIEQILTNRIKQLERENEYLKNVKGLDLNKSKAARYLGYTIQHLLRLEKKYPEWLEFVDGKISISQLDAFKEFYDNHKRR